MKPLVKASTAVLTIPLVLSSLLLRALNLLGKPARRSSHRRKRLPTPAIAGLRAASHTASHTRNDTADVKGMRRALAAVLDAHEGSREVFRYLAHFERRLAQNGLKTLDAMSTKRLRRALAQFEAIVTNWSDANLAGLRSRMAVAVASRDSGSAMWAPAATISKAYTPRQMPMLARSLRAATASPTEFQGSRQVEVDDDISISRFEAALGEWQQSQRQALVASLHGAQGAH